MRQKRRAKSIKNLLQEINLIIESMKLKPSASKTKIANARNLFSLKIATPVLSSGCHPVLSALGGVLIMPARNSYVSLLDSVRFVSIRRKCHALMGHVNFLYIPFPQRHKGTSCILWAKGLLSWLNRLPSD